MSSVVQYGVSDKIEGIVLSAMDEYESSASLSRPPCALVDIK
jgi:hypothetical protein